jgi:signal transduction histidine kinase
MTGNSPSSERRMPANGSELERKTRLLNIMAASGVVASAVFLAIMLYPPPSHVAFTAIVALSLLACVLSLVLSRVGQYIPAALLFLAGLTFAVFGVVLVGVLVENIYSYVIYYLPMSVLCAGILLDPRATFAFATLNTLLIAITGLVARDVAPQHVVGISVPVVILCYLMAVVAWLYGSSLEQALAQLTERSQQLQAANQEVREFSSMLERKVEDRTRELRKFVSMIAHELRTPLTVIKGYTEFLQEEYGDGLDKRRQRAMDTINANVEQVVRLTDDLLEVSRLQSGQIEFYMESLPIDDVIREVCHYFAGRLAEKRLDLKVDLPPDLPLVFGDRYRLTQVLNNLMSNACKYTPSGSVVVGVQLQNSFVQVDVSDTGVGIPLEEQERVFSHFFRGENQVVRSQKGLGLGLTISRFIVERHQGQIWVESNPGQGTTIRFTVPLASAIEGTEN